MTEPEQAAFFRDAVLRWRSSPLDFVRENFKEEPDAWQKEVLRVLPLQDEKSLRIALQSCSGTGKSCVLAWTALWFLICFGDSKNHPQGAAVSITRENLRDYLWKEIAKWRLRSKLCDSLLGQNADKLYMKHAPETWYISARSFPKDPDQETIGKTLSGLHGKYVLVLIDEAGAMPPAIGRTAEQARDKDQQFFKILLAGNPLDVNGLLYECVTTLRELWRTFVVTGDPDDPLRSPRKPIEAARQAIATYGRDNAWVRIYTLGLFPLTALNKFLGLDDVNAAMKRSLKLSDFDWAQNRLGVDPARFGDDRTGLVRRQGKMCWSVDFMRDSTSTEIASRVAVLHEQTPFDLVCVDMGGENSGGVVDALNKTVPNVIGFYSASTNPPDPRFYNQRAYMNWMAAQWIKTGGQLPLHDGLAREALVSTYDYKAGKLIVEGKDDIKARLGASPDLWDAFCLTFGVPDAPKAIELPRDHDLARGGRPVIAESEYDMFA